MQLAREEFGPIVARVARRVVAVIDEARGRDRSPVWSAAVDATLALARAPQHHLRTQLVLLGSLAGGGRAEGEVEELAAALELLHLFMLVHDDVIDEGRLRRGQPTLHRALHESSSVGVSDARHLAIVVGNLLHVLAMRALLAADRAGAATQVVLDANLRTGIGQFEDIVGWRAPASPERLRTALEDKSAYQSFAAPLCAGLLWAAPSAEATALLSWGVRMGVAFQGLDDLADLIGDPIVTGKDNFRDLLEGRLSTVLMLLLERAGGAQRQFVSSVIGARTLDPSDRIELERLLEEHSVIATCVDHIRQQISAASQIADGAGLPVSARQGMAAFELGLGKALDTLVG